MKYKIGKKQGEEIIHKVKGWRGLWSRDEVRFKLQLKRLLDFILITFPGEGPGENEDTVDAAIRIIRRFIKYRKETSMKQKILGGKP